jgi:hypothetical protein
MLKSYRYLLLAFIVMMPFVDVFSFSPWTPIPLLICFVLLCYGKKNFPKIHFQLSDGLFLLSILFMLLPLLFEISLINGKTVRHILGFSLPFIFYYLVVKEALLDTIVSEVSYRLLFKTMSISLLIVSVFIIFEFVLDNIFSFNIDALIKHSGDKEYVAETAGRVLRARGFAAESGVTALFYEVLFFPSIIYVKHKTKLFRIIYFTLIGSAFAMLFSSAGFVVMSLSLGYLFLARFKFSLFGLSIITIVSVLLFNYLFEFAQLFYNETFLDKLSLLTGNVSAGSSFERATIFMNLYELIKEYPFGIGMGMPQGLSEAGATYNGYAVSSGYISLYGVILAYGGLLSLGFFVSAMLFKLRSVIKISENYFLFVASAIAVYLHFGFVAEYWLPFFWFFIALLDFEAIYTKRHKLNV